MNLPKPVAMKTIKQLSKLLGLLLVVTLITGGLMPYLLLIVVGGGMAQAFLPELIPPLKRFKIFR